jgi:hypothetical protein
MTYDAIYAYKTIFNYIISNLHAASPKIHTLLKLEVATIGIPNIVIITDKMQMAAVMLFAYGSTFAKVC